MQRAAGFVLRKPLYKVTFNHLHDENSECSRAGRLHLKLGSLQFACFHPIRQPAMAGQVAAINAQKHSVRFSAAEVELQHTITRIYLICQSCTNTTKRHRCKFRGHIDNDHVAVNEHLVISAYWELHKTVRKLAFGVNTARKCHTVNFGSHNIVPACRREVITM